MTCNKDCFNYKICKSFADRGLTTLLSGFDGAEECENFINVKSILQLPYPIGSDVFVQKLANCEACNKYVYGLGCDGSCPVKIQKESFSLDLMVLYKTKPEQIFTTYEAAKVFAIENGFEIIENEGKNK